MHAILYCFILLGLVNLTKICEAEGEIRACGKKLIQILMKVCDNCFYTPSSEAGSKRSSMGSTNAIIELLQNWQDTDHSKLPPTTNAFEGAESPFVGRSVYDFYTPKGLAIKRGIADDCCKNVCSYDHIKTYCCQNKM